MDESAAELSNIILAAAKVSLKRHKIPDKSKSKSKSKKWFDQDLKKLRSNLISYGKVYSKFPKDPVVN